MELIGLRVKKPMILEIDNKGVVGLANDWSVDGRICHIEVHQYFLWELKEEGIIDTHWMCGERTSSNLFTKDLARPLQMHVSTLEKTSTYARLVMVNSHSIGKCWKC